MRTFWQYHHPNVHHWFLENGEMYSVMLTGEIRICLFPLPDSE